MNCNTCRYELSQCLDGRLPSGRRTVVMEHADDCEACGIFWNELQAAQELTLQLPRERVGESFRDQLWERIRAGEGTPDAVFHEPVPLLVKARYALTGAAAAAAVLLFGLWLHDGSDSILPKPASENLAVVSKDPPRVSPTRVAPAPDYSASLEFDEPTMLSSARRFTSNLVAVETARQIESRYASVDLGLRQLATQQRQADERRGEDVIVERILSDASELRVFAEVMLEMRDRDRVSFPDPEVGADLRLVTNMLSPIRSRQRTIETVRAFVEPTVMQSQRLGQISRYLRVTPSLDPQEEAATLVQLNTMRPEVFTKLFIVLGQGDDEMGTEFGQFRRNHLFLFEDVCGSIFVAPRSQVETRSRVR